MTKRRSCSEVVHPQAGKLDTLGCEHGWPCYPAPGSRLETVITTGLDPAFQLVGSSPSLGDSSGVGIVLPPDPTADQLHRYQCRLGSLDVMEGEEAELVDFHQLASIGVELMPQAGPPAYLLERVIRDPLWHFSDANISWHLMFEGQVRRRQRTAAPAAGWIANPNTTGCGILYTQLPVSLGGPGYQPLFGGTLPGRVIAPYGSVHDIRWPWQRPCNCHRGVRVKGAVRITAWASVHQTDPATRPSVQLAAGGYCDEETFVQANPLSRYWRVGAEMTWRITIRRTGKS